jgi:caffeoyl-CoA O-methyltransferase
VDAYFEERLLAPDDALTAALADSRAAGLPAISVSATQGKLLHLLARSIGATRILEVGTLGGYSTIWLARALPPAGRLVTLEIDPHHAEVAQANLARAGLADIVEIRVGPAADSLARLGAAGGAPFDFVFIDADKSNYPHYFEAVLPKLAPRGLIAADNTLWSGHVLDPSDTTEDTEALRRFNDALATDPRVVVVQTTVRDGVTLIRRAG